MRTTSLAAALLGAAFVGGCALIEAGRRSAVNTEPRSSPIRTGQGTTEPRSSPIRTGQGTNSAAAQLKRAGPTRHATQPQPHSQHSELLEAMRTMQDEGASRPAPDKR